MRNLALFLGISAFAVGCANQTEPGKAGTRPAPARYDAEVEEDVDAGADAGPEQDPDSPDTGSRTRPRGGTAVRPDAGPSSSSGSEECPLGTHSCDDICVGDYANEVSNGCSLSCTGAQCDTPDNSVASCTPDGSCDFECDDGFYPSADGLRCECTPTIASCDAAGFECGTLSDGCGHTLNCGTCETGTTCSLGQCSCASDEFEINDSPASVRSFSRTLDDSDDARASLDAALSTPGDADWFRYPIVDGVDGGNPEITVTLSDIPEGSDYAIAAYFACNDGNDESTCGHGGTDNSLGKGCRYDSAGNADQSVTIETECADTIDEDGWLYIKVTSTHREVDACENYHLRIDVN